ncbi:hypothetical protein ACFQL0_21160 [Haloplanus litoreus]|uniref:hypothetical protein n=1 Tax=Haloplanus litoreus TaxID=767515 RepID=UPI00362137E8
MAQSQLWSVLSIAPTTILVAAGAVSIVVLVGTRRRLGPDADWVEVIRATALPMLDPAIERLLGGVGSAYEIAPAEYVGLLQASPEEVERMLWQAGCRRNVLSATKTTPDGRRQLGAWVYRNPADVGRQMQVDVLLFAGPNDTTLVAAHHEYSSSLRWLTEDPSVLVKHYAGETHDPHAGAAILQRAILPDARWVE